MNSNVHLWHSLLGSKSFGWVFRVIRKSHTSETRSNFGDCVASTCLQLPLFFSSSPWSWSPAQLLLLLMMTASIPDPVTVTTNAGKVFCIEQIYIIIIFICITLSYHYCVEKTYNARELPSWRESCWQRWLHPVPSGKAGNIGNIVKSNSKELEKETILDLKKVTSLGRPAVLVENWRYDDSWLQRRKLFGQLWLLQVHQTQDSLAGWHLGRRIEVHRCKSFLRPLLDLLTHRAESIDNFGIGTNTSKRVGLDPSSWRPDRICLGEQTQMKICLIVSKGIQRGVFCEVVVFLHYIEYPWDYMIAISRTALVRWIAASQDSFSQVAQSSAALRSTGECSVPRPTSFSLTSEGSFNTNPPCLMGGRCTRPMQGPLQGSRKSLTESWLAKWRSVKGLLWSTPDSPKSGVSPSTAR